MKHIFRDFMARRAQKRETKRLERIKIKEEKRLERIKNGSLPRRGRVALCLGGGGARGFAHIGAISVFEEYGLSFDMVVGTSVGSVVGALYAAGVSSADMLSAGEKLEIKDIKKGLFFQPSAAENIGKIVTDVIGDKNIEDLSIPFAAVSVDLVSGREVVLDSGSVATAVSASSAVPFVFKPVVSGDLHLVDGGVLNNIPADVCRMLGADIVITVDVNPTRGRGTRDLGTIGVLKATFSIMSANMSEKGLISSDVIVATDTSGYSSSKKDGYDEMYELGKQAARAKIKEIIEVIYGA